MDNIFELAANAYAACADFRSRRRRFLRFTYGRQWDDLVTDPGSGAIVTEGELASANGRTPLTNNLIRQLVKTVVGRYRNLSSQAPEQESALSAFKKDAGLHELDARNLEEFLISGATVQRLSLVYDRDGKIVPAVENVNPARFFFSAVTDPRSIDADLLGMLHDLNPTQLLRRFSAGSPRRARMLKKEYAEAFSANSVPPHPHAGSGFPDSFTDAPAGRCRVIEVWRLENRECLRLLDIAGGRYWEEPAERLCALEKANAERVEQGLQPFSIRYECRAAWVRYFYSRSGKLLSRDVSPAEDGCHPFVFRLYPLTDGEIHPFVEDIVDQQRCINRMISLIDSIMAASAKGLLLYPVNLKPDNLSWDSIARRWRQTGGIIPYISRPGFGVPQQVTSSGLDAGASSLLDIQMNMMKNVSGVTDALMGRPSSASSGIERYEAELRDATIALTDILDTYSDLVSQRDSRLKTLLSHAGRNNQDA